MMEHLIICRETDRDARRKGGERKKNSGRIKECWWNDIGLPVCVCVGCVFEVLEECRLWLGIEMTRTAGKNELQMRETFG